LVVCRGEYKGTPEGHQVHGFRMYRHELFRRLDVTTELVTAWSLEEVEKAVQTRPADVAMIMVSWADPTDQLEAVFQRLSARSPRPRLIFLDYYAQSSSPHFRVLPFVDRYVKRQVLRDTTDYRKVYAGGFIFTDFLSRQLGYDLAGWQFGSKMDPGQEAKLTAGWNLGVTPKYRRMLQFSRAFPLSWDARPIPVNGRIGLSRGRKSEWYDQYRQLAQASLEPLRRQNILGRVGRVGPKRYLLELFLSKIVVSPFGWGEVCFRDYEAVCAGALLVKPSMAHLRTSPNIYVDGETYASTSWDLRDVAEVCRYYLANPHKAKAIVRNAQAVLSRYFEGGGFVCDIERVLSGLDLPAATSVSKPHLGSVRESLVPAGRS
jgi:hypothetical protein